ncbi:MAG: hypothetical protein R2828_07395 [Saprospiraceae bacterium]
MNNNSAASYEEMMTSLVQNLGQSEDPYKKMLGQVMMQNLQKGKERENHIPINGHKNGGSVQMRQDVKTLIKMNKELLSEYKALQQKHNKIVRLNAYAASALGACECWGIDPDCSDCHGNGSPGNLEIEEQKFNHLIQPFFVKLIQTINKTEGDLNNQ